MNTGPDTVTIVNPTLATATVYGLIQGTYNFRLTVTDNNGATASDTMSVFVLAAPVNTAPTANAGADKVITLPTSSTSATGSGTDADGTIASYAWSQVSGPNTATITAPAAATTSFTGLVAGVYNFRLTVTDNQGATGSDVMVVTVNPAPNTPPTGVNAGTDTTITLPVTSLLLRGAGTDAESAVTFRWTLVSGTDTVTIASPNTAWTNVFGLIAGSYTFRLTVTDAAGASTTDDKIVTVNGAPPPVNVPPTATASNNGPITLPTATVTLTGTGADSDGSITAYRWTKTSGPAATITSSTTASTTVTGLTAGTYVFQLTVTDNSGATGSASTTVVVNPAPNTAPTANAGADQSITLPASSVTITGAGADAEGPVSLAWSLVSGPSVVSFSAPTAATTMVEGLNVAGTYTIKLTVTDTAGLKATDNMVITVNAAPANILPTANAGADTSITLPNSTLELEGIATDSDGEIREYQWTQVGGANTAGITEHDAGQVTISFLIPGTYTFQFRVVDDKGGMATDTINVVVNKALNKGQSKKVNVLQIKRF
jgi:hypothetical protein